ncbi:MAG TPA: sulfotransferase domain-containing protein [Pseudomonadales bacterium]|nr:sulfotransferase domain-containing protein [Pseudomonadales bacterium]
MSERVRHRTLVFDNLRWEGFEFRPGDIVISTPPKCGTTWTQMLCALLIFDGPEFPGTLDDLSPWLDMNTRSKDEVHALLAAQTHRRFIKTHTPLDGLPMDPRVTYLIVGRDPRDVSVSFEHHMANMDFDKFLATRALAVGNDDLADFAPPAPPIDDPTERMRAFIEREGDLVCLAGVTDHLRQGWEQRQAPNVALFHFADYRRDLVAEIQRLAEVLGSPVSEARAAALAAEAGLERMRERAPQLAPDMGRSHWRDERAFFRSGGSGEWRARATPEVLDRYEARIAELTEDAGFVAWLHGGRGEAGAAFAAPA